MLAIFSFFRIPVPESLFFLRCSGHTIEVSTIFHYYTICKQKLNIHGTRTAASVVKQNNENNMWLSRPQYYLVSIQSINQSLAPCSARLVLLGPHSHFVSELAKKLSESIGFTRDPMGISCRSESSNISPVVPDDPSHLT